ncbi:hypothetical protein NDU88_006400 [Pleurodeles waltl]|uniref:Uncharacterized protein n=1 Tax=Pleurodeles waltl TaxID=8319 RepID=A0AAV7LC03_PLEWA|nr:hypothetical protein NDU88_006400 [Pleurodeles waltl]
MMRHWTRCTRRSCHGLNGANDPVARSTEGRRLLRGVEPSPTVRLLVTQSKQRWGAGRILCLLSPDPAARVMSARTGSVRAMFTSLSQSGSCDVCPYWLSASYDYLPLSEQLV